MGILNFLRRKGPGNRRKSGRRLLTYPKAPVKGGGFKMPKEHYDEGVENPGPMVLGSANEGKKIVLHDRRARDRRGMGPSADSILRKRTRAGPFQDYDQVRLANTGKKPAEKKK